MVSHAAVHGTLLAPLPDNGERTATSSCRWRVQSKFLLDLPKVAAMTSRSLKTWARLLSFGIFFLALAAPGRAQDTDRKVIKRVEPEYPPMMKRLEIGGTVRLKVTVRADGSVESVDTLGGNDGLAAAAVKAVQQWKFSPASRSTVVEIKLVFDPHR